MVEFKDTPQYILENSLTQGIKKNILPGKKEEWDYRLAYFLKTWSLKNMKYSLLVADQTPFTRGWVLVAVRFSREPPTAFWKGLPKRAWEVMPFFGVACSQWLTDNWKSRSDLLPQGERSLWCRSHSSALHGTRLRLTPAEATSLLSSFFCPVLLPSLSQIPPKSSLSIMNQCTKILSWVLGNPIWEKKIETYAQPRYLTISKTKTKPNIC